MRSAEFPIVLLFLLIYNICLLSSNPIITRHDVEDSKFISIAEGYPELNALFYLNKTDMAGTLIAKNWVLSAAHVAVTLSIGDTISTDHKGFRIRNIIIHPEWDTDQAFDLALIQIETGGDSITAVPIYRSRDELHKIVVIAGHGDRGTGLTGPAGNDGRLRAATNRIDAVSDFWLKWDFDNPETDSSAATDLEGISGPGDSSGPAFIFAGNRGYLAGISSGQSTRATGGREGVYGVREYYVRISSYVEWITTTIARNSQR